MHKIGLLCFAFFTITHFSYTQNQKVIALVNQSLLLATDTVAIHKVKSIVGDNAAYSSIFDSIPSINPLNPKKLKRFSSEFGNRFHPIDGKYKKHLGIDISAAGGTPVHSAAAGVIKNTVSSSKGYGNQVFITHAFGFSTRYAHLYQFIVKKGQQVKKGDIIGFVGSTGKSTANHLHFEILKEDKALNPYPFCFLY